MSFNDNPAYSSLAMDRSTPISNTADPTGRGRLGVTVLNQTSEPIPISIVSGGGGDSVPLVVNAPLLANTEATITFSANARQILIKARNAAKLQFCFVSGQSASNFITISPLTCYSEIMLNLVSRTMFIQSNINTTLEVLEWT